MSLILSLSKPLCKSCQFELPRKCDEFGQNPGVQALSSHSTQISWQLHFEPLNERKHPFLRSGRTLYSPYLLIAVEAYSRYTMMHPYFSLPKQGEFLDDFNSLWLAHILEYLGRGGFVRGEEQACQVLEQFNQQAAPELFQNRDQHLGGVISDRLFWLESFILEERPREVGERELWQLCDYINQRSCFEGKRRNKANEYFPQERFIADSLHRFAKGLCGLSIPGCRRGEFPNPHRAAVNLSVVKG